MARLFLIGNGYAIDRRNDTKYIDFRNWLIKNYLNDNEYIKNNKIDFENLSKILIYEDLLISNSNIDKNYKNELETNQFKQTAALLYYFMGKYDENWSQFEEDFSKDSFKRICFEF